MTNAITELLESVAESGSLPTRAEIDVIVRRGGRAERDAVAKSIMRDARQIRLLGQGQLTTTDGDSDGEITRIIADAAEQHARYVADDPSAVSAATNKVVDEIVKASREGTVSNAAKRAAAKDARQRARPLRDLLEAVADGAAIHDSDLAALELDPTVDDAGRTRFRGDVVKAVRRVGDLRKGGAFGDARTAAQMAAAELGGVLAGPRNTDPMEGVDDPRELAAAISARSNGRG